VNIQSDAREQRCEKIIVPETCPVVDHATPNPKDNQDDIRFIINYGFRLM
jgi:hypothetical protein